MNFSGKIRKITIQSPPATKDAGGELTGSWTDFCTTYAKLVDVSSGEGKQEGSEVNVCNRLFIIRYRSGVLPNMKVLFGTESWEINGIKNIGVNEFIEISTFLKSNQ